MISFAALPARAAPTLDLACMAGCTTNSNGSLQVDYTVPSDGQTYRWDLYTDASNPTATITLQGPNEVFANDFASNGDGTISPVFAVPGFVWNELVAPGHTTITLSSDADFNNCASNPAKGTICQTDNFVWGNSALLKVNVASPVTVTFTQTLLGVPEPATWSLLIGGFLALGLALRWRRAAGLRAA